jgi:hypothetical protein
VPPRDTSDRIIPKTSAKIPVTVLYIKFARPLPAATAFRVRADSMPSLTGAVRSSERVFTTPRPAARPDTGRARPDTGSLTRPPGPAEKGSDPFLAKGSDPSDPCGDG